MTSFKPKLEQLRTIDESIGMPRRTPKHHAKNQVAKVAGALVAAPVGEKVTAMKRAWHCELVALKAGDFPPELGTEYDRLFVEPVDGEAIWRFLSFADRVAARDLCGSS